MPGSNNPGIRERFDSIIELMAVSIGIPHQVHPVPAHFSPKRGKRGVCPPVRYGKFAGLQQFQRGRVEADEVKINPADPGSVICWLSRL